MMRSRYLMGVGWALGFLACPAGLAGQARVGLMVGAGVGFPSGALAERQRTGPFVGAGFYLFPGGGPVGLRVEGNWGDFPRKGSSSDPRFRPLTFTGSAMLRLLETAPVRPYLLAGGGVMTRGLATHPHTRGVVQAGLGALVGRGPVGAFAEARVATSVEALQGDSYVPILVGITIRL